MIIVIHAANIHDSVGAREVMRSLKDKYITGIQKIFADGGYLGELIDNIDRKAAKNGITVDDDKPHKFRTCYHDLLFQ